MSPALNTLIYEVDIAHNSIESGDFEYKVLRAVANLFGGNRPVNDVLAEVYSELHQIESVGVSHE